MDDMFRSLPDRFGHVYDINVISTSPWVITIDNFLTDIETTALIENVKKWEQSTDTGSMNEFGETFIFYIFRLILSG